MSITAINKFFGVTTVVRGFFTRILLIPPYLARKKSLTITLLYYATLPCGLEVTPTARGAGCLYTVGFRELVFSETRYLTKGK
jgi:hypothetical protein